MACYGKAFDATKAGTRELVAAPGAGLAIKLLGFYAVGSAADGTLKLQDGAGTPVALTGTITLDISVNDRWELPPHGGGSDGGHWGVCTANKALNIVLSANMDCDGAISYEIVRA